MTTSAYPIGAPIAMTLPLRVIGSCAAAQFGVAAHTATADKRKGKTETRMSPPRWTVHLRTTPRFFPYTPPTDGPLERRLNLMGLLRDDDSFEGDRAGRAEAGGHHGAEQTRPPAPHLDAQVGDAGASPDLSRQHILGIGAGGTGESPQQEDRSEERRVGKECRSRWLTYH